MFESMPQLPAKEKENPVPPVDPEIIDDITETPEALARMNETPEMRRVMELLNRTEALSVELDEQITERFGADFLERLQGKMNMWAESFLVKGDKALSWVEMKGVPLPKTRAGARILSGCIGTAGAVIPGLGIMLPIAYVLWKRSATQRAAIAS